MCIATYPAPAPATTPSISGSAVPADTSLTIVAPARSAASATAAFVVSTLIGTSTRAATSEMTGSTRAISVSASTGSAPGRVDSPPTSSTAAPAPASSQAWATALAGATKRPPSEKESGVTFTTPMTGPAIVAHRNIRSAEYRPPLGSPNGAAARSRRPDRPLPALLRADQRHRLGSRGGVVLEDAPDRGGHGERSRLADAAHRHAQVLALQQDEHALRPQHLDHRVGDLRREPLLHLRSAGVALDQAGELRQTRDPAVVAGDVRHVRHAVERHQMVLARRVEGDVADHHHLVVTGLERDGEVLCRVLAEPDEDLLVHARHATGRGPQTVAVGILTDRHQDLPHRAGDAVEVHTVGLWWCVGHSVLPDSRMPSADGRAPPN